MAFPRSLPLMAAAVNLSASILAWAVFFLLLPLFQSSPLAVGLAERIAGGVRLAVIPGALILAMVTGVIVARVLAQALNPVADPETRLLRVSQRVLSNTIEQTLVFLPALAGLATVLPPQWLGVLVLLVGLFVGGRLIFWIGYLIHPYARAPGMAITYNVNLGMILYLLVQLAH